MLTLSVGFLLFYLWVTPNTLNRDKQIVPRFFMCVYEMTY